MSTNQIISKAWSFCNTLSGSGFAGWKNFKDVVGGCTKMQAMIVKNPVHPKNPFILIQTIK
jgi:hypothetical protein